MCKLQSIHIYSGSYSYLSLRINIYILCVCVFIQLYSYHFISNLPSSLWWQRLVTLEASSPQKVLVVPGAAEQHQMRLLLERQEVVSCPDICRWFHDFHWFPAPWGTMGHSDHSDHADCTWPYHSASLALLGLRLSSRYPGSLFQVVRCAQQLLCQPAMRCCC